jgi:hypothetical protein
MGTRMRSLIGLLAVMALVGGGAHAAAAKSKAGAAAKGSAKPDPEVVASSFQAFCDEWMHKLAARERDNIDHVKWQAVDGGVQGTYVGYEQQHTCKLAEGTEADPVAKVFYREVHYTKRGSSVTEAQQSPPKVDEIFEVQEIFHYLNGKWDY